MAPRIISSPILLVASTLLPVTFTTSYVFNSPSSPSSRGKALLTFVDDATAAANTTEPLPRPSVASTSDDQTILGNLVVPSVGIGTISWSTTDKPNSVGRMELQSLVNTACNSNAAFFDTAERYGSHWKTAMGLGWGETEMLTRQLLENGDNNNDNSVIATKFTPSPWRTTVNSVLKACEESRRRLGVDQIDLYQLHMPDIVQPLDRVFGAGTGKSKDEIYWEGLAACYNAGLVKNVGVCNYGSTLTRQCQDVLAKKGVPLASNQIAYSLLGRHNGAQQTVDTCNELGVKVLAFFPFAMGLLTGKYNSAATKSKTALIDSLLTSKKTAIETRDLQSYAVKIAPLLRTMERIAENRNKTVSQVALNYIVCKGALPIPGARTEQQLVDNLGSMGWRLDETEIALLEAEAGALGFGFDGAGFKRAGEKFVGYGMEQWVLD